ncbi:MAG TPA: hypothetical protein VMR21_00795 [Vicinamibacteria bacterium]|nr:hypothetical protein [Vicinamibacteria bacterium]
MRRRAIARVAGAAALVLAPSVLWAAPATAWLHVRVEEAGRKSKVAVNLPVSAVEAALQAAPETVMSGGRIKLGHRHNHMSVADLRSMWKELKAAGDNEFVTVEEEDQTVRVARKGDLVLVHVDRPSGRESVRVEVPIDVVDALFSGQGEELDLRAAFALLQNRRGDIVRVQDKDSTVRIWIDEAR